MNLSEVVSTTRTRVIPTSGNVLLPPVRLNTGLYCGHGATHPGKIIVKEHESGPEQQEFLAAHRRGRDGRLGFHLPVPRPAGGHVAAFQFQFLRGEDLAATVQDGVRLADGERPFAHVLEAAEDQIDKLTARAHALR